MKTLYILNQVYGTLYEWANDCNFILPTKQSIDNIVEEGIVNIKKYLPQRIIKIDAPDYKESIQYLDEATMPIFLSPETYYDFREYLTNENIKFADLKGSRSRILSSENIFYQGSGVLLGRDETLRDQLKKIKLEAGNKPCFIFDDVIFSGGTFVSICNEFRIHGLNVLGVVSIINRLAPENSLNQKKVESHYYSRDREDMIIEMKDFLAIPGSGAAYPKGAFSKKCEIQKAISNELENLKITGQDKETFINNLTNSWCFNFLEKKDIEGLDLSITSNGRLLYLYPGMHSKYWQINTKQWKRLSFEMLELTMKIFYLIEKESTKKIMVRDVGIFDEWRVDPNLEVIDLIKELLINIKQKM